MVRHICSSVYFLEKTRLAASMMNRVALLAHRTTRVPHLKRPEENRICSAIFSIAYFLHTSDDPGLIGKHEKRWEVCKRDRTGRTYFVK
jgi:hypothetical protein